jgi:hypothetical protein
MEAEDVFLTMVDNACTYISEGDYSVDNAGSCAIVILLIGNLTYNLLR